MFPCTHYSIFLVSVINVYPLLEKKKTRNEGISSYVRAVGVQEVNPLSGCITERHQ